MSTTLQNRNSDRRHFIGGSDARIIMGDNEEALVQLWREKRGEVEPEDLSGNLVVQLGIATEDLNRHWYEANTGQVLIDIELHVQHPALRWMAATLDGRVQGSEGGVRGQVHAALVLLRGSSGRKIRTSTAA
jgi:predicted phage-related endonuclease